MPFENESFDILNCNYLVHELPHEVKRERVLEFSRVLKPGGLLAFNHSIQEAGNEQVTNEINNWLSDSEMIALLEEKGFERYYDPQNASCTKVFCFIKKHAGNSNSSENFQDFDLDREVDKISLVKKEDKPESIIVDGTEDPPTSYKNISDSFLAFDYKKAVAS